MDIDLDTTLAASSTTALRTSISCEVGPGLGRERYLTLVPDALGGHGADRCPSLVQSTSQIDAFRRNDPRAVDHSDSM